MTLADIVAVMSGPDRVRITKGNNELFAGYLGNLVHMAEYEALMAEEVTRIKGTVDITHAFKGDISKYFASIPHDKLKDENRRYIGDKKALMLMDDIIDHNGILPDGVGIPVGNLTSQLFANVYGNKLDKFCKHVLHIPYFVRYMDDFIILSDDLEQLKEWVKRIEEFLENEMLLHINPKSTILYAGNGIDFCGYIHYADHKKVRKSSIRKLKQDVKAYELGKLPPEEFNRKYESRKGHLGHADTYHIAKVVEYELLFYEWERLEATA